MGGEVESCQKRGRRAEYQVTLTAFYDVTYSDDDDNCSGIVDILLRKCSGCGKVKKEGVCRNFGRSFLKTRTESEL